MEYLIAQLDIFKILMDGEKLECFSDILKAIKNVDSAHTSMISEVIQICVLIHVNPATSASGERSFSTARRIKSWLRAKMSLKRFNHVALLNSHKTATDNLRLVDVANEFIARKENRKRNFGTFTVQDLLPWSVGFYRLALISSLLVTVFVLTCSCSVVYSVSLLNENNEH